MPNFISIFFLFLLCAGYHSSLAQGIKSDSVIFSKAGGFCEESFKLKLTSVKGGVIYYTTDGSVPGFDDAKYTDGIKIAGVAVIRTRVFKDGKWSEPQTQSYFCDRNYSLPVISIATEPDNFWSYEKGIYVKGCCADSIEPYKGANFWHKWEYPANIEMYEPDGVQAFNQQAGIRIFGEFSRILPQKSLSVIGRNKYGKKYFKYPIFDEKPIKKYKSFILRNSGGDFNKTQFRDALVTGLVKDIGLDYQAYRPAIVFLNGKYWGIQNMREKINEHFLKFNHDVDKDSVDIMKHRLDLTHGTRTHYKKMLSFLRSHTFEDDSLVAVLNTHMDIDNYINYNIAEIYCDNRDAGGNIRYWRPQTEDGRWRWILFDTDMSFGITDRDAFKVNTLGKMTTYSTEKWPNPPWSTFIIRKLLENDSLKNIYINRLADHLNTIYHPGVVVGRISDMEKAIETEMPYHFKRWGGKMKRWREAVQVMKKFAAKRPSYIRSHMLERFNIEDTVKVKVQAPAQEAGSVVLNSLEIDTAFEGVYFKNISITLKAKPKFDYEFVKWEGIGATDEVITFIPKEDIDITPVFKKKEISGSEDLVVINELGLKQDKEHDSEDWIELANMSSQELDLSGWMIKDTKEKHLYIFSEGTKIAGNGFLVVCQNAEKFSSVYRQGVVVADSLNFGLSSKGETLRLYDASARLVDSLSYRKGASWPIAEKQKHVVIALKNAMMDNHVGENWEDASKSPSPGVINPSYQQYLDDMDINRGTKVTLMVATFGGFLLLFSFFFYKRRKQVYERKK